MFLEALVNKWCDVTDYLSMVLKDRMNVVSPEKFTVPRTVPLPADQSIDDHPSCHACTHTHRRGEGTRTASHNKQGGNKSKNNDGRQQAEGAHNKAGRTKNGEGWGRGGRST